jgi:hypothetical protein
LLFLFFERDNYFKVVISYLFIKEETKID